MEEKRKLLHEILDLVIDINGFEKRDRSLTGNEDPTVFFEFNGHVADVSVRVHDNGWLPYADPDFREDVWLFEGLCDLKKLVGELARKKEELNV